MFVKLALFTFCFVVCILEFGATNEQIINIDVSSYTPDKSSAVFKYHDILTEGNTQIFVGNVSSSVGFFVVQVHSYVFPIELSNSTEKTYFNTINGTNVGLVQINRGDGTYEFFVTSDPTKKVYVLITVVVYNKEEPIPGGCNMTFNIEIAPYQNIKVFDDLIRVDVQAASLPGLLCELSKIRLTFYHLYLNKNNYSKDAYFNGIESMLTVDDIVKNGNMVLRKSLRNYYNSYRGVGSVFAVVARAGNYSSAYVPAVSYACDLRNWDADCSAPVSVQWKIMCAALLFFGIFMCYTGHRSFKGSLFFAGFVAGASVTYLILVAGYGVSLEHSTVTACVFGIIYGCLWVYIWIKFGMPFLSVHLSFIISGVLIASIMFYSGVQDIEIFRSNVSYWMVLVTIALSYTLLLMGVASVGHILVWAMLGSYAVIAALSHYFSGNLQYIIINTFRRATVENFNQAVIDPPYQTADMNLTVLWVFFFITGVMSQMWLQRSRPPFPPNRALYRDEDDETTPFFYRHVAVRYS